MGTACSKAEEFEREVVVAHENLMHQKRVFPPPEIIPALPELVDFKGIPKKKTRQGIFEDPDFPAANASLGGVTGDNANPNVAKYLEEMMKSVVPGWARPCEMVGKDAMEYKLHGVEGEPCLFKHVSPRDITQGYLGDCWLVASFSALAEYPDRVRSLFRQQTLTEDGRYDIRLYDPHSEEWMTVTIDDRLPYWKRSGKHGNLCFAKQTKENEFWPCLLDKAVAKFVMSYHRIDGGFESSALEMLTGKPAVRISLNPMPGGSHWPHGIISGWSWFTAKHATVIQRRESYDANWGYYTQDASKLVDGKKKLEDEELWAKLRAWDDVGYSMSCPSRGDYKGIMAGHAYTLLRFVEVPLVRKNAAGEEEKSILRLLHVRNPHHTNEWYGPFSDSDSKTWNKYPEALEATGHKIGFKDNGVFWMDFRDFSQGFTDVAICFDQQNKGARYTDDSAAAIKEHQAIQWGTLGHQKWEGLT